MKTLLFIFMTIVMLLWFLSMLRRRPYQRKGCIDTIMPAHNEGPCLAQLLDNLLYNPYFCRVICVNDGSTDNTEAVMAEVKHKWDDCFVVVTQKDTDKGDAPMSGLNYTTYDQVFLSDADTCVPPDQDGVGYMLAKIERDVDAVGGILSTALKGAGLLPHIRTTVKLPMIVMKRTLQQFLSGALFTISSACEMFCTDILRRLDLSDRTKVGDLDLTWILVANGYRIRQVNRCIAYPQKYNSPCEEWRRWRRWITGYAVCIRLHERLLFGYFGIFSTFLVPLVVLCGVGIHLAIWLNGFITTGPRGMVLVMFPLIRVGVVYVTDALNAWFHRYWLLAPSAPLSVVYILLAYAIWIIYGLIVFFIGREPQRGKPTRYSALVEASTAYSHPSITGTEKPLEA